MAEGGQLGAGAHRAEDPALLPGGGGELVRGLAGDPGARLRQLEVALRDVVLGEGGEVRAEGIGLHTVHADGEIRLVDRPDDIGAGDVQNLVAAFEVLEIIEGGVLRLEHGAHGAVGDHHAGRERLTEGIGAVPAVTGKGWQRGHGKAPVQREGRS
ncbi:hypothetical protein GCM10020254_02050 [Streptomyces goshikiensis]